MDSIAQGTLVADRYRIIREIGFGGMGTVWLSYDEALESHCALKLIGASQAKHEEFRIRFECEAKCAAQLRGAHVVDVLNRGQWQGKPFIVMEYLEGEDLSVRLERFGRLDARTTYRIVAQVARALMRAHALGIVHRDIKPGNIFLVPGDEHEIAKILDFGVAKHRDLPHSFESEGAGQFIGTPCYMSPEQATGLAVDARSDLWSLAVITFECLTGDVPFQDESMVDLIHSITHGDVPSLTASHPELPRELEHWWQRAISRDPNRRFQSAKEFADALAEAIGVYPLPVSGFPPPIGDAPTVLDPFSIAPASRRPNALALGGGRRKSYETDAAVTIHSQEVPSRSGRASRSRSVQGLPYMVAAGCVGAALALAVGAWRPALSEVLLANVGFQAGSQPPPLPQLPVAAADAASSRGELRGPAPRFPGDASVTAGLNVTTLASNTPEPTVLVVSDSRPPAVSANAPAKLPVGGARKPNHWHPLATPLAKPVEASQPVGPTEPAGPTEAAEKDYGI